VLGNQLVLQVCKCIPTLPSRTVQARHSTWHEQGLVCTSFHARVVPAVVQMLSCTRIGNPILRMEV
jgi:hypothetical protein